MHVELYNWEELCVEKQTEVAAVVSAYTQGELGEKPQMLPVTRQDVTEKFAGVIAMAEGVFSGYVAATTPVKHMNGEMSEVGSLWVPKTYRGQGVARALVGHISEVIWQKGVVPYAFCNPLSIGVFKSSGYEQSGPEAIPVEAFRLCMGCPKQPDEGCCDRTVVYTGGCNE